jgi:hypothetical protein
VRRQLHAETVPRTGLPAVPRETAGFTQIWAVEKTFAASINVRNL